jgi:hypothetical protein
METKKTVGDAIDYVKKTAKDMKDLAVKGAKAANPFGGNAKKTGK